MNAQGGYDAPGTGQPLAVYEDVSNTYPFDELYDKKMTLGMVDTNLEEGDLLRFVVEDQNGDPIPLQ